jgi:hypothetical protein
MRLGLPLFDDDPGRRRDEPGMSVGARCYLVGAAVVLNDSATWAHVD